MFRLRDNQGNTTLHKAVTFGRTRVRRATVDGTEGLDIDATNKVGATALHYAVRSANLSMVNLLIEKGANSVMKDEKGSTPTEVAQAMSEQEGLKWADGTDNLKKADKQNNFGINKVSNKTDEDKKRNKRTQWFHPH